MQYRWDQSQNAYVMDDGMVFHAYSHARPTEVPLRIYKPAPFRPARRLTDLEARLLSASNGLTDTSKVEHLQ